MTSTMTKLTNRHGSFEDYFVSGMLFEDGPNRGWAVTSHSPDNETHVFWIQDDQFHSASIHWAHPRYGDLIVNHGSVESLSRREEELIRRVIKQWEDEFDRKMLEPVDE